MSKIKDELIRIQVYEGILDRLLETTEYTFEDARNYLAQAKEVADADEGTKLEDTWQYESYLDRSARAKIQETVYKEIEALALRAKK